MHTKGNPSVQNQEDIAWKDILDLFFKEFIHYCLPKFSRCIDWDKEVKPLDKELQAISARMKRGKRFLDKLIQVSLKNSSADKWILIHVEIQGSPENEFEQRMLTYACRIWDRYQKPFVPIVVLTDSKPEWRPEYCEISQYEASLRLKFIAIKLLDYQNRKEELEASENPFASVILSQLTAMDIKKKDPEIRKQIKFNLTKRLYEKGFNKSTVTSLYRFIDWLIGLPEALELKFENEVQTYEETLNMPYMSSIERFGHRRGYDEGIEIGLVQGIEQGKIELVQVFLNAGLDPDFIMRVTGFPMQKLQILQNTEKSPETV